MGFISHIFDPQFTSPLTTDKYHLTTAYAYWLEGRTDTKATFYVYNRHNPNNRKYSIAAGLEGVLDVLSRWQEFGFTDDDIKYLESSAQLPGEFTEYLKKLKFNLKIWAAPEGSIFLPQEPILRVRGNLIEAKMLESVALSILNGHCAYASHAAAMMQAVTTPLANGAPIGKISVQGLRRGPSFSAAIEATRSLILGGYDSTSTAIAARTLDLPLVGTMDHAWVMTHEFEIADLSISDLLKLKQQDPKAFRKKLAQDAFRSYAICYPDNGVLLVDTFDTITGIDNAITVIKELRALGMGERYGIRFDSGDITHYSKIALRKFAEAGFISNLSAADAASMSDQQLLLVSNRCSVFCAASNNIDEEQARTMRSNGAYIEFWGIGTASSLPPPIGLVYKASLVEDNHIIKPVMKVSKSDKSKSSWPGQINSRHFFDSNGKLVYRVIYDELQGFAPNNKALNDAGHEVTINHNLESTDLLLEAPHSTSVNLMEVRHEIRIKLERGDADAPCLIDLKLHQSRLKII